ncbi:Lanthionine biosynthesis protein LanM [Myxococcus hansupus]|uniref:Lanthionine biosynthesis protein LanM n=1 Tax=Pseudomyxococcus hansupus TaxID=1297742 RepID=A0A0H4X0X5_9BACT|nr:type 2 lanthipeptide synthetase LanM family protein [Myxococcus hansupus]AKQ67255.1 Lanthionine biosynthesis protein LanM [Myxococcus hansupus]
MDITPRQDPKGLSGAGAPSRLPRWARAATLSERAGFADADDAAKQNISAAARKRLDAWRQQVPFGQSDWWLRRLRTAGLTEAALLSQLEPSLEAPWTTAEAIPEWVRELEQAYEAPHPVPVVWPERTEGPDRSAFLPLVEPLVSRAVGQLTAALTALRHAAPGLDFEPRTVVSSMMGHLPQLLSPVLSRALVVELHATQWEAHLAGETPEARFQDFTRRLHQPRFALDILERYPVMARCAVRCIAQWRHACLELMQRLTRDAPQLWPRFNAGREPGALVEARGGLSDPHRGGRGVFILRFESGFQLVYKPRSLGAEAGLQQLLSWLNERGATPTMKGAEAWDRGDHGWMEYVAPAPCESRDGIRRFYERQGAYVAVMHVLDGTDLHFENVIAAGEHPVLVDVETLFHPVSGTRSLRDAEHAPEAPPVSVMRSGLLPQQFWGTKTKGGIDLSGLGARAGQLTPQPVLVSAERGTDRMRFERRPVAMPASHNVPRLEGEQAPALAYRDALSDGFARMYGLLLAHREALLADDGPLAAFAGVPMRVLFRNTAVYGALLYESYHPHTLSDGLERQRFFDHLWRGVLATPDLEALIPLELEELERGDLPYFTANTDSTDLESGTGQRLRGFFAETGMARVRRRLTGLSAEDGLRQRWVLERSLDVLLLSSRIVERPSYDFQERATPGLREALLSEAHRAGERLMTLAFERGGEAHWLSLDAGEGGWRLTSPGADVFKGRAGIALALGYLGEATGDARFTALARSTLRTQTRILAEEPQSVVGLGLINGWGGILYALTHLGVLWGDDALLDEAASHVRRLRPLIEADRVLDVGAGAAGCLLTLLVLGEHRPSGELWAAAAACGQRLMETATPQARGKAWICEAAGNRYLAGMAHGAAGICLALLRLYARTGDTRLRDAAREGMEFERGLYDARERNWPDLRAGAKELSVDGDGAEHFMWAWCTGAPGIGLARLLGLPWLDDVAVREELAIALDGTLARGFGRNHGLCHGDLGNVDFLLEAADRLGDASLRERTDRVAGGILQGLREHGHLFGLQGNTETPGLLVGLAGIAYGLARLAVPERLPSLLAVAAPRIFHGERLGTAEGGTSTSLVQEKS